MGEGVFIPEVSMKELRLGYSIYTLDGIELLPAGRTLPSEVWRGLPVSRAASEQDGVPIFGYGTIREDLLDCIGEKPYDVIFSLDQARAEVLRSMAQVRIPLSLLAYLDYFKENDSYTYLHSLKVFALSTLLADIIAVTIQEMRLESTAGPLHDLGKFCVPLSVLNKALPLTRVERAILEHHTVAGYVLLGYYMGDHHGVIPTVAKDHHERRDGSGYPRGIRLADRMVEVIAAADIFDALLSPRPYKPTPFDNRTALEEITDMASHGKLSWDVVKALIACDRRSKPDYRYLTISTERRGTPPQDNVYGIIADE